MFRATPEDTVSDGKGFYIGCDLLATGYAGPTMITCNRGALKIDTSRCTDAQCADQQACAWGRAPSRGHPRCALQGVFLRNRSFCTGISRPQSQATGDQGPVKARIQRIATSCRKGTARDAHPARAM